MRRAEHTPTPPPKGADRRSRITPLRPLVLITAVVWALLAAPAPALAAEPCWKQLVSDYWADNRVDRVYPVSCYREAMEKLPSDVQQYSDAQDDLRRALLAAIREARGEGRYTPPGGGGDEPPAAAPTGDDEAGQGFFERVLHILGPKNADSVPVPLLVLAGIAVLLAGAAGVSYGARWLQARRIGPVAAPTPPAEHRS